jgi:hypothetical protein
MPIKSVSGPRCLKHQIECTYNCGWCGKPVCEECVEFANGKKYCDKCWEKKQKITPAPVEASRSAGPRVAIKNVDNSMAPEEIERHRASFAAKKKEF